MNTQTKQHQKTIHFCSEKNALDAWVEERTWQMDSLTDDEW